MAYNPKKELKEINIQYFPLNIMNILNIWYIS